MLSDHERRSLRRIEADLAASDPGLAQSLVAGDHGPPSGARHSHLLWVLAVSAALLVLLSLAAGLPTAVFGGASLLLGALVCHLNSGGHI